MAVASPAPEDHPGLMSIGHSVHPISVFARLLEENGVGVVADVRSAPYSRFNPQFNRENLRRALRKRGIGYEFCGGELGGRPEGDEFYDLDGHVLYGRMAETGRFRSGLSRLLGLARDSRVAIMCSEEEPAACHRFLLITRVLCARGEAVAHIRGDGSTQRTAEVTTVGEWSDPVYEEPSLLGSPVRSSWRSPKPVPGPRRSAWRR